MSSRPLPYSYGRNVAAAVCAAVPILLVLAELVRLVVPS